MRREEIPNDLAQLAFEFFYWFSRFEFALKENGYLRNERIGAAAEADWNKFVARWHSTYSLSAAAMDLTAHAPGRQIVANSGLEFAAIQFPEKTSDLAKVVRFAKTVRNNLFHGGKHGFDSWDEPDRMRFLLRRVIEVLNEL